MTEPPAPPVPPGADLRAFAYMPIDVRRLLSSDTWLLGTGDQKAAALSLWLEAWHQVPAGSLPNVDRALEQLSQAGRRWAAVRDFAMRGWVLHADGRLYHGVVVEKVLAALVLQKKAADRRAEWAAEKAAQRAARKDRHRGPDPNVRAPSVPDPLGDVLTGVRADVRVDTPPDVRTEVPPLSALGDGDGEKKEEIPSLRSGPPAAADAALSPRDLLWMRGPALIGRLTGKPDRVARAALGRLVAAAKDDASLALAVLGDAEARLAEGTALLDPMGWMMAQAGMRAVPAPPPVSGSRFGHFGDRREVLGGADDFDALRGGRMEGSG